MLEDGTLKVLNKGIAMRHRLSMGTIVSDANLKIRYQKGGYLGTVEEWFVAKLKPGDVFTFSGRNLELIRMHNMEVIVRKSKSKKSRIPAWMGGRMSFSAHLSDLLKQALCEERNLETPEFNALAFLYFTQQQRESIIPAAQSIFNRTLSDQRGLPHRLLSLSRATPSTRPWPV